MVVSGPLSGQLLDPSSAEPSALGRRIAETARAFWNQSSADGPDGGNLACAYMVNKVLYQATGRIYGQDPTTVNSVRENMLAQEARPVSSSESPLPGDIAFTFNDAGLAGQGGGTAHIGIFIQPDLILANSSHNRRFNQLLTLRQFNALYPHCQVLRLPDIQLGKRLLG